MNKPLLSIFIPTYNRLKYVSHQLEFLFDECKEYNNIEIVVRDNNSNDGTIEYLKKQTWLNKVIYNDYNMGPTQTIFSCEEFCSGKYLWMVSDDDVLEKGIVSRVVNILEQEKNLTYLYLNYSPMLGVSPEEGYGEAALHITPGRHDNAFLSMENDFKKTTYCLLLMTGSIYRMDWYVVAQNTIPCPTLESYSINYFTSLTCLKNGPSYFEEKVWIHTFPKNISWANEGYLVRLGILRSFDKLREVGYSSKEVKKIYRNLYDTAEQQSWISVLFDYKKKTGDFSFVYKDWKDAFRRAPIITLKSTIRIICSKIPGKLFKKNNPKQ